MTYSAIAPLRTRRHRTSRLFPLTRPPTTTPVQTRSLSTSPSQAAESARAFCSSSWMTSHSSRSTPSCARDRWCGEEGERKERGNEQMQAVIDPHLALAHCCSAHLSTPHFPRHPTPSRLLASLPPTCASRAPSSSAP